MTFANNLDPDGAPQNVGLHLRSKLFDIQIIHQQKKWVETMNFLKYLKKLPSMQRVKLYSITETQSEAVFHLSAISDKAERFLHKVVPVKVQPFVLCKHLII